MNSLTWHLLFIVNILRHNLIRKLPWLGNIYVRMRLNKRKGECLNCGNCCFNYQTLKYCKHREMGKCKVYKTRQCSGRFPLDNLDIKIVNCPGYWFNKGRETKARYVKPDDKNKKKILITTNLK